MSQYLVARITATPNIEVRYRSEVVGAAGDGHLESLSLADRQSGAVEEVAARWLFVFIGASPRTAWLGADVVRDDKGFIVTGQDLTAAAATRWPLARAPFALETSVPGVFAAGDVRRRWRVASPSAGAWPCTGSSLPGDDPVRLDDLRALSIFDGLSDEPPSAAGGTGSDRPRVVLFRRPACRLLVGARRGPSAAPYRTGGRRRCPDGRAGRWAGGFRAGTSGTYL
jgi:hypothetical protein